MSTRILSFLLPRLPRILLTLITHLLSLTPQSKYWDLRTALTVALLRSYFTQPKGSLTVEAAQALITTPRPVDEKTWKVDADVPVLGADAEALEALVRGVIFELQAGGEGEGKGEVEVEVPWVGVPSASGEWIAARESAEDREGWSEERLYGAMMQEVEGGEESGVVLWLHGGGYWLCDPSTHRPIARKVAKSFKGRVFLPRYRLAPQHPFPAALIDALCAYLYLLHPPPGAAHQPIPATRIILGGDSAGGGLCLSLLQLLLHLHRRTPGTPPYLHWHGSARAVPLPAGVVGISAWTDVSRCLGARFVHPDGTTGSEDACKDWDYIPAPGADGAAGYKRSPAWPEGVGRVNFYAPDALITNPLVSPITARSWVGAPPVWMSVGDECLRDSNLYFAHRLHLSNVQLQLTHFTALPHVHQITLPHLPASRLSLSHLGEFLSVLLGRSAGALKTGVFVVHPVSLREAAHDREALALGGMGVGELVARMEGEVALWGRAKL